MRFVAFRGIHFIERPTSPNEARRDGGGATQRLVRMQIAMEAGVALVATGLSCCAHDETKHPFMLRARARAHKQIRFSTTMNKNQVSQLTQFHSALAFKTSRIQNSAHEMGRERAWAPFESFVARDGQEQ